jgi:hypothetical protein
MANIDLFISEKCGKSLGMRPYRPMRFIENGEVELMRAFRAAAASLSPLW